MTLKESLEKKQVVAKLIEPDAEIAKKVDEIIGMIRNCIVQPK